MWWSELPYHMETSELMNVDKKEEISVWWSELPYHLKEDILACLPLHSLCRFSAVCSEWNALFSSTKFITNLWAKAIPNRKPLLILCSAKPNLPSMVYNFFTRTWKTFISFNFLQGVETQNPDTQLRYSGCVDGVFLVCNPCTYPRTYHVCNPLTRKSLQLERTSTILDISCMDRGGEDQRAYKVVVVGTREDSEDDNARIVVIYDPSQIG